MAKGKEPAQKAKIEAPFDTPYFNLLNDLFILRELNNQLPKSIEQLINRRQRKFKEKVGRLDKKTREEYIKLGDFLEKAAQEATSRRKPKKLSMSISVSDKIGKLFKEFLDTFQFSTRFNKFIRDMSLVYLIAEFESFLQGVLTIAFQKKPEALTSSQKSITFEELMKFNDINNVKQRIVEKEALSVINQDIEDVNDYFKQKFNTDLSQFTTNWKKFKERFYRRNIIIHNSGMINMIYRAKTGYKGKSRRLIVSRNYLKDSIKLFQNMGFNISEHFSNKLK